MEFFSDIFSLNNILAVVLLFFITLQHQRATKRDLQFFETMNHMIRLLQNCQDEMGKVAPRN